VIKVLYFSFKNKDKHSMNSIVAWQRRSNARATRQAANGLVDAD
jgi:hypothetical protein